MCIDPILWNCLESRSYDFSRVWLVSGWERGPPPRLPRTNIWTSHKPPESWDLGLSRDVWGVQIFVRGRRVAEEWRGPWCSDPTIYDLLTRLSFSLTWVSTLSDIAGIHAAGACVAWQVMPQCVILCACTWMPMCAAVCQSCMWCACTQNRSPGRRAPGACESCIWCAR